MNCLVCFPQNSFRFLKDPFALACSEYVNAKVFRTFLLEIHDWPEKARLAKFNAARLGEVCGVSRRTLERFFHDNFGKSPQAWLEDQRQQALESLITTGLPLKQIAFETGYKQPSHMTKHFREVHGVPPSKWRMLVN